MKAGDLFELGQRQKAVLKELLVVWESAVRETHCFLSETDIECLKPLVVNGLQGVERMFVIQDDLGCIVAFMGLETDKLEMLFVGSGWRGRGLGRIFVNHAIEQCGIKYVDVNEQNPQAIGFYEHLGFRIIDRSELDGQGNPFPILHMKLR